MSAERFFLKPGYRQQEHAPTFDSDSGKAFWQGWRIRQAAHFQHHVYARAARWLRARGGGRVLDLGCGYPIKSAQQLQPVATSLLLIDQPSLAPVLAEHFPQLTFLAANLEELTLSLDQRFDLVICADVLEHLMNPNPCLDFIRGHLDPGGVAVLSTPERDYLRGPACDHSPKPDHVREWNQEEFARYVASRGFTLLEHELQPMGRLPWWEEGLYRGLRGVLPLARWRSGQMIVCQGVDHD